MAIVLDRPLAMNQWDSAVSEDRTVYYDHCYNTKRFFYQDNTQSRGGENTCTAHKRRKKRSKSCDETGSAVDKNVNETAADSSSTEKSEFAAMHHERALNAGRLNKTDRGRRWRKKVFNKIHREDKSFE